MGAGGGVLNGIVDAIGVGLWSNLPVGNAGLNDFGEAAATDPTGIRFQEMAFQDIRAELVAKGAGPYSGTKAPESYIMRGGGLWEYILNGSLLSYDREANKKIVNGYWQTSIHVKFEIRDDMDASDFRQMWNEGGFDEEVPWLKRLVNLGECMQDLKERKVGAAFPLYGYWHRSLTISRPAN